MESVRSNTARCGMFAFAIYDLRNRSLLWRVTAWARSHCIMLSTETGLYSARRSRACVHTTRHLKSEDARDLY